MHDPADVFRKAFENIRPGGVFEVQDLSLQTADDDSMDGTALSELQTSLGEALRLRGNHVDVVTRYKEMMLSAGFEHVTETRYRWPSNPDWADEAVNSAGGETYGSREKELGELFLQQVEEADLLEHTTARLFAETLRWDQARTEELLDRAKAEMRDPRIRAYTPV